MRNIFMKKVVFDKAYTQVDIANLLDVKPSSRIGTSMKDFESWNMKNPAGKGGAIKCYYGKSVKEAIWNGKFDWAFNSQSYVTPPKPTEDFIPEVIDLPVLDVSLYDNKSCKTILNNLSMKEYRNQKQLHKITGYDTDGIRPMISSLRRKSGVPIMTKNGKGWKVAANLSEWTQYTNRFGNPCDFYNKEFVDKVFKNTVTG